MVYENQFELLFACEVVITLIFGFPLLNFRKGGVLRPPGIIYQVPWRRDQDATPAADQDHSEEGVILIAANSVSPPASFKNF